jgi:hypothetical protein
MATADDPFSQAAVSGGPHLDSQPPGADPFDAQPVDNEILEAEVVDPPPNDEAVDSDPARRFLFFSAVPAWLISMLLHMLLLILMALLTVAQPVEVVNILSVQNAGEAEPEMEQFTLEDVEPASLSEMQDEAFDQLQPTPEPLAALEPVEVSQPVPLVAIAPEMVDIVSDVAPSKSLLQSVSDAMQQDLGSRGGRTKKELLKRFGGTEASEAAVARALKWISLHQLPNGAWSFNHAVVCRGLGGCNGVCQPNRAAAVNAATAMGLLPFLGAGQTHLDGTYKETVMRGLMFLVNNGQRKTYEGLPCLDLSEEGGNMYSHGLAAIALCEAYAMTGDPALLEPSQLAINYIVYSQDPRTGGWRYGPRQAGDTSVTGWQVMALKSGHMGHLLVPPQTISRTNVFLDLVSVENGAAYKYMTDSDGMGGHLPCQPIGLLCRMYMGTDKTNPALVAGVEQLAERGVVKNDIYYNYYAAQVLRHHGGPQWDSYNAELRDWLVESQVTEGHPEGSWHWTDSQSHRGPLEGGRLCSTSFATMILEVYYRHMPLYNDAAADDDFPL